MCTEDILGPNLGKMPKRVILNTLDNLPNGMLNEHGDVTIAIDIPNINKVHFMMTAAQAIQQIIKKTPRQSFGIKHILGDQQFECIRGQMELQGINMNITGREEHVPEVERYIRMVKERIRATVNTLPFEILPH